MARLLYFTGGQKLAKEDQFWLPKLVPPKIRVAGPILAGNDFGITDTILVTMNNGTQY